MVDQQLGPSTLDAFRGDQLSVEETTCLREPKEKFPTYLKTPQKAECDCSDVRITKFTLMH